MPTIDFTQLAALPLTELALPEPMAKVGGGNARDLFSDYMRRANTVSPTPAVEERKAGESNTQASPPPKAEQGRTPDDRAKASQNEKPIREKEPANEASLQTNEDSTDSSDVTCVEVNEKSEVQTKPEEAKQSGSNEEEAQLSEENAVKEKKKAKKAREEAELVADPSNAVQKNSEKIAAISAVQLENGENANEVATDESTSETDPGKIVRGPDLASDASAGLNSDFVDTDAVAASSKQASLTQLLERKLAERETQPDADNPADAILDAAGKVKAKAKKAREVTADEKNVERKQKAASDNRNDTAAHGDAESSATSGKGAGEGGKTTAMPQISTNVMQSVVEVLKNAEKPAMAEAATGPIGDARGNTTTKTTVAAAAGNGRPASAQAGNDNGSAVQRAQFVQRVERAFAAMGNRDGSVRLKLSPPDLGVLKMEIGVRKGVMKARVEAETPAAQSLLLDNLPELRERLAQQNIHIQQFDVDLMDRSPDGMPQHAFGQSDSDSRQGNRHAPRAKMAEDTAVGAKAAPGTTQRPGMGGSLNVFV